MALRPKKKGGGKIAPVTAAKEKAAKVTKTAKLGTGKRFAAVEKAVAAGGARNPAAVAATIGRKKFGKKRFQALAAKGKK